MGWQNQKCLGHFRIPSWWKISWDPDGPRNEVPHVDIWILFHMIWYMVIYLSCDKYNMQRCTIADVTTLGPDDTFVRQWTVWSVVPILVCCLLALFISVQIVIVNWNWNHLDGSVKVFLMDVCEYFCFITWTSRRFKSQTIRLFVQQ